MQTVLSRRWIGIVAPGVDLIGPGTGREVDSDSNKPGNGPGASERMRAQRPFGSINVLGQWWTPLG